MTHAPRREELLDLALGLLGPAEAAALEAHARGCPACSEELASLRRTRQLIAGLPPVEAPARGQAALLAAARRAAEAAVASRPPRWAAPRWLWGGTLGLAGAAAVAVLLLQPGRSPRPPSTEEGGVALRSAEQKGAAASAPARVATSAAPPVPMAAPAAPSAAAVAPEPARAKLAVADAPARSEPAGAGALQARIEARSPAARLAASGAARMDASAAPCRLEQRRLLTRDEAGQVTGRTREGRYPAATGDVPLTVVERYGPDGRLLGAEVRAGDRRLTVSPADVEAGRLEPLPGLLLARTAEEAISAPPRCEP